MNEKILDRAFYNRDTLEVAKNLLGCILINRTENGLTAGKIVDVEAYITGDPASHSYNGITARNKIMFGPPGHAYVYFIYGMYFCFNTVTREEGVGEGVMLRALEPLDGITLMRERRGTINLYNLCNGPAKLVQAMGIDLHYNGKDLTKGNLVILNKNYQEKIEIIQATRVGIKKGAELLLRFYIKGNNFISKQRRLKYEARFKSENCDIK